MRSFSNHCNYFESLQWYAIDFFLYLPINFTVGTFYDTFPSYNSEVDNLANGWGNGNTLYLSPNVNINNGLGLTITSATCPTCMVRDRLSF
jgi:hypothetical protein